MNLSTILNNSVALSKLVLAQVVRSYENGYLNENSNITSLSDIHFAVVNDEVKMLDEVVTSKHSELLTVQAKNLKNGKLSLKLLLNGEVTRDLTLVLSDDQKKVKGVQGLNKHIMRNQKIQARFKSMGLLFGYPEECISTFIAGKQLKSTIYSGSGYTPSEENINVDPVTLIGMIQGKRRSTCIFPFYVDVERNLAMIDDLSEELVAALEVFHGRTIKDLALHPYADAKHEPENSKIDDILTVGLYINSVKSMNMARTILLASKIVEDYRNDFSDETLEHYTYDYLSKH